MTTLIEVLRNGRQIDEDGIEVAVSREAVCTAAEELQRQAKEIKVLKADAERYRWHRLATMKMYPTLYRSAAHYDLCADANETLIYENAIAQQKETP